MSTPQPPAQKSRSRRGRWLVVALILFGSMATGGISAFWKIRLGPFAAYRRALKSAFPEGGTIVEGGDLPTAVGVMRVVLTINFTPTKDDDRVIAMGDQVVSIVEEIDADQKYTTLSLYLVHKIPQKTPEKIEVIRGLHGREPAPRL